MRSDLSVGGSVGSSRNDAQLNNRQRNQTQSRDDTFQKNPQLTKANLQVHEQGWRKAGKSGDQLYYDLEKVRNFIADNPVSAAFLRREKGKLPYSVFKSTADEVRFIKSAFRGRPPTVFFPYPTYVQAKQDMDADMIKSYPRRGEIEYLFMSFLNSDRTHIYNAVVNTMKNGGFEMLEAGEEFNLLWTGYTQV